MCDEKDNDCDGEIDEVPECQEAECTNGDREVCEDMTTQKVCQTISYKVCVDEKWTPCGTETEEICTDCTDGETRECGTQE